MTAKRNWKPATQLVHAGTLRSQFGETSEAIYHDAGFRLRHRRKR